MDMKKEYFTIPVAIIIAAFILGVSQYLIQAKKQDVLTIQQASESMEIVYDEWLPAKEYDAEENMLIEGGYCNMFVSHGEYAFETVDQYPWLVSEIEKVKDDFSVEYLGVSYPNRIVFDDNDKYWLLLSGCKPHDCPGNGVAVAVNVEGLSKTAPIKIIYLEDSAGSQSVRITGYGNPVVAQYLYDSY